SDRWHLYIVDTGDALVALRCVPSDMAGRLDRIPVRVMALEDDPLTRTLLADYGGRPRIANDLLPIALRADFGAEGLSEEDIDVVWGLSVLLILAGSVALLGRWVMKRRRKGE
ncbi:MAG: hypothetical protein FWG38_09500, partial [Defluviitaleaceae bacterium]|nr:hypothetical protein [Defluviitaleaceae bacterium]